METITEIYADQIVDPVDPMRTELDREAIDELAASIKQEGLIQPIIVRPVHNEKDCPPGTPALHQKQDSSLPCIKYEVVAGHRRYRACLQASVVKIPCIVRELNDDKMIEQRAHENLFRQDLDPVEEAIAIAKLVGEEENKIPTIAKRMGKSEQWVNERLDIMTYPDYLIAPLKERKIKIGVAKALAAIDDDVYRKMFTDRAVADGMSVWQAEYYRNQWQAGIYKDSAEIMPPDENAKPSAQAVARAQCEKCGGVATGPNLRTAFIHRECPPPPFEENEKIS